MANMINNKYDEEVDPLESPAPASAPDSSQNNHGGPESQHQQTNSDGRYGARDSVTSGDVQLTGRSGSTAVFDTIHDSLGVTRTASVSLIEDVKAGSSRNPSHGSTVQVLEAESDSTEKFSNVVYDKKKKHHISWGAHPFQPGQEVPSRHSHGIHYQERQGSIARMGKGSVAAVDALRRGSHAVLSSTDMLREIGNPLDLQINETRRLSATPYRRHESFDGRKPSIAGRGRKPSMYPVDIPEVEKLLRADDDPDSVLIKRLAAHDDVDHMLDWKRWLYMTTPYWALLSLVSYWGYFALRIRFTIAAQEKAHKIFGLAWLFIAVEIGVAIPMVMHRTWSMLMVRGRRRPKLRLLGNTVPSVDVVITCCGEDDELVFDTALAACNVDYPADRFRVMIFDDGASTGLKTLVEDPKKHTFTNMYYFSRPKYPGVPHHFKAGNLNYALEQTSKMEGGAANFFAALDADMIPEKDWLRGLLPHMLQDDKCSMACPPQQFYNVPMDDPLCQSLDTFIHISEPIKDALGVAWCTGSGYIMRRDALDSIGNFPLGSLAEDVCTSSMLLGAGWNTVFVHEPLQYGTVPESMSGHLKQRTRWTIGTVQTSVKLRFCLFGPLVKHMTFMQRASGFVYTVSSLFTVFLVMSLFTIPVVLYAGGNLVPYATKNQLIWLIRFTFINMVLNRINEWVVYLPSGYFVGQRDARGMLWMAPYHALSVIQYFMLPKWLGGSNMVFTSSGSQSSELNERDVKLRAPLLRRLKVTLWDCKAWLHLAYIFFVLGSIVFSIYRCFTNIENKYPDPRLHENATRAYLLDLLTHAGWPPVLWLVCAVSCWTPMQYAIAPPSVPDRDVLLQREQTDNGGLGAAYPTDEAKKIKQSWVHLFHELQYSSLCAYQVLVFAWSFYL